MNFFLLMINSWKYGKTDPIPVIHYHFTSAWRVTIIEIKSSPIFYSWCELVEELMYSSLIRAGSEYNWFRFPKGSSKNIRTRYKIFDVLCCFFCLLLVPGFGISFWLWCACRRLKNLLRKNNKNKGRWGF